MNLCLGMFEECLPSGACWDSRAAGVPMDGVAVERAFECELVLEMKAASTDELESVDFELESGVAC